MSDVLDTVNRFAVGNFQLQCQLAEKSGQAISISGYIYSDDDELVLNNRLDIYKRVIARQQKISEIPLLEAQLNGMRDALKQHQRMYDDAVEKQKRGERIPSSEKLNVKNLEVNIRHVMDQITKGEEAIQRLKSEVA